MVAAATLRRLEEEATASIRAAFVSIEMSGAAEMRNDHCPECRETSARFAGHRWDEITTATLLLAPRPSIALLTPAAFQYYLPALMLCCVEAPVELDVLPDEVIGNLSAHNAETAGRIGERWRDFTAAQVAAVLSFLCVLEMRQRIDNAESEEALEWATVSRPLARAIRYWTARAESVGE